MPEIDGDMKSVLHALDSIGRYNTPFEHIDEWLEMARARYPDPKTVVIQHVEELGETYRHSRPHKFSHMVVDRIRRGATSTATRSSRPVCPPSDAYGDEDEVPFFPEEGQ